MSTREEPRQLRLASWQQIFADRAASGLSVKDYCEANNLKRDQYFVNAPLWVSAADVWRKCRVFHGKHECSVSPDHSETTVMLKITATQIKVMDMQQHLIVTHRRLYGDQKQSSMEWIPYLTAISRKPRSLFNSGLFDMMPDSMQRYMKLCSSSDRGTVLKVLAELTEPYRF